MDYHIDAKNKILGRVATDIALILQGKKSATYQQNRVSEDKVYVKNIGGIRVTGNKAEQKIYYRHTGYVGHLKELTYDQRFAKDPSWVLRQAVKNMLPKNFLKQQRIKNLIFVDAQSAAKVAAKATIEK